LPAKDTTLLIDYFRPFGDAQDRYCRSIRLRSGQVYYCFLIRVNPYHPWFVFAGASCGEFYVMVLPFSLSVFPIRCPLPATRYKLRTRNRPPVLWSLVFGLESLAFGLWSLVLGLLYSVRCKFTLSTSARLSIDFAEGLRAARYLPRFRRRASVRLSILFPCFNHLFDTIPTGIGEEGIDRMENEPIGRAKNFYGALDFSVNTFVITASQAQSVCSTN